LVSTYPFEFVNIKVYARAILTYSVLKEKVGVPEDLDKFRKQFKQYYRNCSFSKMGII